MYIPLEGAWHRNLFQVSPNKSPNMDLIYTHELIPYVWCSGGTPTILRCHHISPPPSPFLPPLPPPAAHTEPRWNILYRFFSQQHDCAAVSMDGYNYKVLIRKSDGAVNIQWRAQQPNGGVAIFVATVPLEQSCNAYKRWHKHQNSSKLSVMNPKESKLKYSHSRCSISTDATGPFSYCRHLQCNALSK